MAITVHPVLPGVYHIADSMGVCQTLLVGEREALLVDAGYGIEDIRQAVEEITALPYRVILTHGHHDHALGARFFEETWMFPQDLEDFAEYTAQPTRTRILNSAKSKGLAVDEEAYLAAVIPQPRPLCGQTIDLGGLTA
jgi:glyoxylase-like metal-dependent hydrolase (beta-lactamase superfamily II)